MVRIFALAVAVTLAACSPSESSTALAQAPASEDSAPAAVEKHPTSGLQIIEVAVVRGDKRIVFKTELANTPEAQARGLMFRTELRDDEAMLFPSGTPQARSFWMKNTPLGLDIIFIGVDGRISNIEEGVPYSTDSVASAGLASAVFEVRNGLAEELGIVAGDRVEYALPE